MFQISRRADYAVRIMIELGAQEPGQLRPARIISRRTGVPKAFLHKIASDLSRAGLVRAVPGLAGGLALAQPPGDVTMLHILEAVEGPVCVNVCLVRPRECPRDAICPAHGFFGELQMTIVDKLSACTLEMLVSEAGALGTHFSRRKNGHPEEEGNRVDDIIGRA